MRDKFDVAKPPFFAQMMRWTPPGDLNGIEVPKSSRIVKQNNHRRNPHEEYNHRY